MSSHCNFPVLPLWDESKVAEPLIYCKDRCWSNSKEGKKARKQGRKEERKHRQDGETDKLNYKTAFSWAVICLHARCPYSSGLQHCRGWEVQHCPKPKRRKIFKIKTKMTLLFISFTSENRVPPDTQPTIPCTNIFPCKHVIGVLLFD